MTKGKGKFATSRLYDTLAGGSCQSGGGKLISFVDLINNKKEFLVKIFATLIFQLGLTYYVMMNYQKNDKDDDKKKKNNGSLFYYSVAQIIVIIIMAFVPMPIYIKFLLFTLFSYLGGVTLSVLAKLVSPEIINAAIISVLTIFGLMFAVGLFLILSGIELGLGFGSVLFFGLLGLIIVRFVMMLTSQTSNYYKSMSVFGLILFSLYIVYDTNKILQKDYFGDFVTAALDYYLDILNLFLDWLSISQK
jgi:FtsH-binding integral membrane protein